MKKGVFIARKKDGTTYFRSSFTYKNKHISLGSYNNEDDAHKAYCDALFLTGNLDFSLNDYLLYFQKYVLPFEKGISILNYRDHGIYIGTPIYIRPNYFEYYLHSNKILKFDVDDLFYYSSHKIMERGNHLFVSDYGMQITLLSRYGIKNYSVPGKDYYFMNNDSWDLRYRNIKIINRYYGVQKEIKNGRERYITKIHIKGNFIVGKYKNEQDAAIAYNKAIAVLKKKGVKKDFFQNYIEDLSSIEYATRYNQIRISKKIRDL